MEGRVEEKEDTNLNRMVDNTLDYALLLLFSIGSWPPNIRNLCLLVQRVGLQLENGPLGSELRRFGLLELLLSEGWRAIRPIKQYK